MLKGLKLLWRVYWNPKPEPQSESVVILHESEATNHRAWAKASYSCRIDYRLHCRMLVLRQATRNGGKISPQDVRHLLSQDGPNNFLRWYNARRERSLKQPLSLREFYSLESLDVF